MNKKLLPALIAMSIATSATAEVDVYGKVRLAMENVDEADTSTIELRNNASRLGFKGSEEMEGGMTVVYQYELGINPDDNTTWTQRNSFLGVKGNFGLVKAGHFDSAFKSSQGKVDVFGDTVGDIGVAFTPNENRVSNTVAYSTPNMNGFGATLQYIASETDGVDDGISSSVSYGNDALYLAAAYDSGVEEADSSAMRVVGTYIIGSFQLGALYEDYEPAVGESGSGWLLSGKYDINAWALKAQYSSSEMRVPGATTDSVSVGFEYSVSKTFKWEGYAVNHESEADIDPGFAGGFDATVIGFGAELKF